MDKAKSKDLKRKINKTLLVFTALMTLTLTALRLSANSISSVTMDVYITESGDARITETWVTYLDQGTEGYRSFDNLGISEIKDFMVSDDSGKTYTYLDKWQIDASFADKKYKNGINHSGSEVELCWGISNYGNRTYTLNYTITDLVTQYTDIQGIYFNFLKLSQSVDSVKIRIHSAVPFTPDDTQIWAFGYHGEIVFDVEGDILMNCTSGLSSTDYMVALIRFNEATFSTENTSNRSFDDIFQEALIDSDYIKDQADNDYIDGFQSNDYNEGHYSVPIFFGTIFSLIFNALTTILIFGGVLVLVINKKAREWLFGAMGAENSLDFGSGGKTLPSIRDIPYWRDIPGDKDLFKAYWLACNYDIDTKETLQEGVIGAILLKWVKENKIDIYKSEKKGLFNFKDNNYTVDLRDINYLDNAMENKLLVMLKEAAGENQLLERKEFEKWCRRNYSKMIQWFDDLLIQTQAAFVAEGSITKDAKEVPAAFGRTKIVTIYKVDPSLKEEAIRLSGLKRFLLEFSIINEREYIEVHIWEEYLIYAQLLGIADKVAEQFSKLYPNFREMTNIDLDTTYIAISSMAHSGFSGMQAGYAAANSGDSGGFSGGGGSSSSGGGGSSGGSSGGGFR